MSEEELRQKLVALVRQLAYEINPTKIADLQGRSQITLETMDARGIKWMRTALEQSCTDARNESPEAGMGACPQWDALRKERDTIADAFADVAALFFNEAEWDYADVHPRAAAAIEELAEARRQVEKIIGAVAGSLCTPYTDCVLKGEDRCVKCWRAWAAQ